MSTIGEKIYKLRSERGLTLEELAQKIGVGKSTVFIHFTEHHNSS